MKFLIYKGKAILKKNRTNIACCAMKKLTHTLIQKNKKRNYKRSYLA
jgi:hypothetical protein